MNFGITAAKYTAAFENLTGETFEDSQVFKLNKEATVDVIDYLDGQDNLDDMQKALKLQDKASSEIAIFVENTSELEAIVLENEKKILDGSATPQDVVNANEALATVCALFGFDKPVTAGFEAIGNDPVESLKIANEGLGDTIAKGFTAIIDFFKKLFTGIWKFIKGLFGQNDEKNEQATKNLESVGQTLNQANVDHMKKLQDDWKNDPAVQSINGNLEDLLNGVKNTKLTKINQDIVQHGAELIKSFKILGIISNLDVKDLKSAGPAIEETVKRIESIGKSREKFSKKNIVGMVEGFKKEIEHLKSMPGYDNLTLDTLKDSEVMVNIKKEMSSSNEYFISLIKEIANKEKVDLSEVLKLAEEINNDNDAIMHFSLVPKIGMSIRQIDKGKVLYRTNLIYSKFENKINFVNKHFDGEKQASVDMDLTPDDFLALIKPESKHVYENTRRELDAALKKINLIYRNYDRINTVVMGRIEQSVLEAEKLLNGNEILSQIMNMNAMFGVFKANVSENMLERDSIEKIVTALYSCINHFKHLTENVFKK